MTAAAIRARPMAAAVSALSAMAALVTAACDAQTGDDYLGEPLADLHGVVRNEVPRPPDDLRLMIVWLAEIGGSDTFAIQGVRLSGAFPVRFRLELYEPPPADALNDFSRGGTMAGEARIGTAYIIAAAADATLTDPGAGPVGGSEEHVLVWVETDLEPGSRGAGFVGGPLDAGYHLMRAIAPGEEDCPQGPDDVFDCLRPAPDGFDTEVEIRIADDLDVPDFT
jgi:hypothetical protein